MCKCSCIQRVEEIFFLDMYFENVMTIDTTWIKRAPTFE